MRRLPLRLCITLASAVSTALILGTLSLFVYTRLHAELIRAVDAGLRARAEAIASGIGQPGFSLSDGPDAQVAELTQILTPSGRVQAWSGSQVPRLPGVTLRQIRGPAFVSLSARAQLPALRAFVLPTNERRRLFIVVGSSLGGPGQTLGRVRLLLAVGDPAALVLASLAAWFLTGAALRPVERLRREAAAISESEPSRRLPELQTNDEIARLGQTLNSLLDRLQRARDFERRLLDNASHELRTPLAILKAELDLALSRARTPAELEATVRSASEEADRMASLAEDLLVLSRARDNGFRLHRIAAALDELLERACAGHRARAGRRGVRIECWSQARDVMVDPMRLRQAVDNLLDNAVRHCDAGGLIRVHAAVSAGLVRITVQNSGPGFPEDILPRAFEPFVTRAGAGPAHRGAGLGLAIVRAVAEAHGGAATAENLPRGARATITLALDPDRIPDSEVARR